MTYCCDPFSSSSIGGASIMTRYPSELPIWSCFINFLPHRNTATSFLLIISITFKIPENFTKTKRTKTKLFSTILVERPKGLAIGNPTVSYISYKLSLPTLGLMLQYKLSIYWKLVEHFIETWNDVQSGRVTGKCATNRECTTAWLPTGYGILLFGRNIRITVYLYFDVQTNKISIVEQYILTPS